MSDKTPDVDVASVLVAAAIGLASGDVACGRPHSISQPGAEAIRCWVESGGGRPPDDYLGGGSANFQADVDVYLFAPAATPDDDDGTLALARAVRTTLHRSAALRALGYFWCTAIQSEPRKKGKNEAGQILYMISFVVKWNA